MTNKIYIIYSSESIEFVPTWEECKSLTHGLKGKSFKSFKDNQKEEMALWMLERTIKENEEVRIKLENDICNKLNLNKSEIERLYELVGEEYSKKDFKELQETLDRIEKDNYVAYVDGSYNLDTQEYSYGVNIVFKGDTILEDAKKYPDKNGMRQINGELKAAIIACNYAIRNKIKKIYIAYDYEGIEKFATNQWSTKSSDITFYKDTMQNNMKHLDINFIKIPAHSNFKNNEKADVLAKGALGIKK